MSFLKFWGKKEKSADDDPKKDEVDPEVEKRRLRHSLSISRSGRFKQKKRDRGQIQPELFSGQEDKHDSDGTPDVTTSGSHTANGIRPSHNTSHPRSPNTKCRDVNSKISAENMRLGRSVVT
ncbi:unnamed protein product [Candidula unifasciata]|uniref:Uncharacterized protein n=1 Tax=Candidula unifasciata TaxID=100452 RepID=A0A8S4A572_9EUPU|nr:unnamed protein product [Candidula unifasciata]